MGRIRTIKPEFFQHERLSELNAETHLFAAGLLTYADDEGFFNANPGLVKAAVFPLRECSVSVHDMLTHLSSVGFVRLGTGEDGRTYGHIVEFLTHQRVNRPTPSKISGLRIEWHDALSAHEHLNERSPPERKGREQGNGTGNGEQGRENGATAPVAAATPECPHAEIIDLYHERCPGLPRVREWTEPRRKLLRQRWREKPERQCVGWWDGLFQRVACSPFLNGANDRNWTPDLEWILRPANFVKVIEGRYDVAPLQRFSNTTRANIRAGLEFINGTA